MSIQRGEKRTALRVPAKQRRGIHLPLTGETAGTLVAWLAGVAASGIAPGWADLGRLLLGILLISTIWSRLLECARSPTAPPKNPKRYPRGTSPSNRLWQLPYTQPGSLSAACSRTLRTIFQRVRIALSHPDSRTPEAAWLVLTLLAACALLGHLPVVALAAGLALLGLLRLAPHHTGLRAVVQGLCLLSWPWWLGHTSYAPLDPLSLLSSLLWGLAASGAMGLQGSETLPQAAARFLIPQACLAVLLAPFGPIAGTLLAFLVFGQWLRVVYLPLGGSLPRMDRPLSPWAAIGLLLSGMAIGGWLH